MNTGLRLTRKVLSGVAGRVREQVYRWHLEHRDFGVPAGRIALSYGGCLEAPHGGIVHGGRVKLAHLSQAFPEREGECNVLYLVSSAMPPHARTLVTHMKAHGVRFVWNQNGVAYPAWAGAGFTTVNRELSALMHLADFVVYQSEFCKRSAERYLGAAACGSEVIYNCVDTSRFEPSRRRDPAGPLVLLLAGSHQQPERVHLALEALAELKSTGTSARLLVAGRLDWEDAGAQVAARVTRMNLADDVDYHPAFTQAEAPDLYRRADVLLHLKYKDPCPTVVIEAMACGVPVVGSSSGGMHELVGDAAGVLLAVPDSWDEMQYPAVPQVVEAVREIAQEPERWRNAARARAVRLFDKSRFVARHRELFEKLALGRGGNADAAAPSRPRDERPPSQRI